MSKQAVIRRMRVYGLVNNRTEGNPPLTLQALTDQLNDPVAQAREVYDEPVAFVRTVALLLLRDGEGYAQLCSSGVAAIRSLRAFSKSIPL
jgi:hypothetical protein